MNLKKLFIIITYFLICPKLIATPIIQLSFQPHQAEYARRMLKKIRKKGNTGKNFMNQLLPHKQEAGIFATYGGF
jgi:hypothetical protein